MVAYAAQTQPAKPAQGSTASMLTINKTYNTTFYCLKYLPPENRNSSISKSVSKGYC